MHIAMFFLFTYTMNIFIFFYQILMNVFFAWFKENGIVSIYPCHFPISPSIFEGPFFELLNAHLNHVHILMPELNSLLQYWCKYIQDLLAHPDLLYVLLLLPSQKYLTDTSFIVHTFFFSPRVSSSQNLRLCGSLLI